MLQQTQRRRFNQMDGSLEERRKEENIPLIKMSEGKRKVDYQRTISSIKDPQVRFILLSNIYNIVYHNLQNAYFILLIYSYQTL